MSVATLGLMNCPLQSWLADVWVPEKTGSHRAAGAVGTVCLHPWGWAFQWSPGLADCFLGNTADLREQAQEAVRVGGAPPALSLSPGHLEPAVRSPNTNESSHSPALTHLGNLARCSLPEQWKRSPKPPRDKLLPSYSAFPTDKSFRGWSFCLPREGPCASPEDSLSQSSWRPQSLSLRSQICHSSNLQLHRDGRRWKKGLL